MISSKILPENEDSAAFDSILQVGHRLGGNGDQRDFYRKTSKLTL